VALLAEEGLAMANWSNNIDFLKKINNNNSEIHDTKMFYRNNLGPVFEYLTCFF